MRSTVTYLDALGSPTVILNTSSIDGTAVQPALSPSQALVSYPQRSKHVIFRGDLLHGVPANVRGSTQRLLTRGVEPLHRVTFLVNWWQRRPGSPNCIDDVAADRSLALPCRLRPPGLDSPRRTEPLAFEMTPPSSHESDGTEHTVMLGDGAEAVLWSFKLPAPEGASNWGDSEAPSSTICVSFKDAGSGGGSSSYAA